MACDTHPDSAHTIGGGGNAYWHRPSGAIVHRYAGDGEGLLFSASNFTVMRRRAPLGQEWLISGTILIEDIPMNFPGAVLDGVCYSSIVLSRNPVPHFGSYTGSSDCSGSLVIKYSPGDHLTVFAAEPDSQDRAHFTIPCRFNGVRHVLDAFVQNDGMVRFASSTGSITFPVSRDAAVFDP